MTFNTRQYRITDMNNSIQDSIEKQGGQKHDWIKTENDMIYNLLNFHSMKDESMFSTMR